MKNFFEKLRKSLKYVKNIGSDADLDFKLVIGFFFVLTLIFLISGVFKLKKSSILGEERTDSVATTTELIDEKELDNVINSIKSRKENFAKTEREGLKIVDPFW